MKKILFGIGTLNVGGTEKHLIDILDGLDKKRFDIHLLLLWQNGNNLKFVPKEVKVYKIPSIIEKFGILAVFFQSVRLFFLLTRKKFSFVHFFLPHMYVVGGILSWVLNQKIIMSRRSLNNYQKKKKLFRIIERFLHSKCSCILVNSSAIRDELINQENVKKQKIKLIYNGVKNYNKIKNKRTKIVITCIANFIHYKRHFDILKAFKDLKCQKSILKLVGNGNIKYINQLKDFSSKSNIGSRVEFVINESQAHKVLGQSDIGVLASEEEGFSNAILEYMSYGLPVVASNVGGNKEAITNKINGFLFEVGDYKKLAYYIDYLIKNPRLLSKLGKSGQAIQRKKFTIKKQTDMYTNFYENLI